MPDYERIERPPLDTKIEHIAVTFVIDISNSMNEVNAEGKSSIQQLNNGLNDLVKALGESEKHKNIVDISIITFGEYESEYQPFAPVGTILQDFPQINLTADHPTTLAAKALDLAVENTRARVKLYSGGFWKPWIVYMTDGHVFDDISAVSAKARQREADGKLRTFAIGIGDQYDHNQLTQFSDRAYAITGYKIEEFLSWVGNSIGVISESATNMSVALPSNQDPKNPGQTIFNPIV